MKTRETQSRGALHGLVSWLAANVAFIAWHKHWKGIYLHCVHPRYCVRLYLWGCDWHLKGDYALGYEQNAHPQTSAK